MTALRAKLDDLHDHIFSYKEEDGDASETEEEKNLFEKKKTNNQKRASPVSQFKLMEFLPVLLIFLRMLEGGKLFLTNLVRSPRLK